MSRRQNPASQRLRHIIHDLLLLDPARVVQRAAMVLVDRLTLALRYDMTVLVSGIIWFLLLAILAALAVQKLAIRAGGKASAGAIR
jgi:hypothetical protein